MFLGEFPERHLLAVGYVVVLRMKAIPMALRFGTHACLDTGTHLYFTTVTMTAKIPKAIEV